MDDAKTWPPPKGRYTADTIVELLRLLPDGLRLENDTNRTLNAREWLLQAQADQMTFADTDDGESYYSAQDVDGRAEVWRCLGSEHTVLLHESAAS